MHAISRVLSQPPFDDCGRSFICDGCCHPPIAYELFETSCDVTLYLHTGKDLAVSPPTLSPRSGLSVADDRINSPGSALRPFRSRTSLLAPLCLRTAGVTRYPASRKASQGKPWKLSRYARTFLISPRRADAIVCMHQQIHYTIFCIKRKVRQKSAGPWDPTCGFWPRPARPSRWPA
jgi:hypothetical protein